MLTVSPASNPVAEPVTVVPAGPEIGLSDREGGVCAPEGAVTPTSGSPMITAHNAIQPSDLRLKDAGLPAHRSIPIATLPTRAPAGPSFLVSGPEEKSPLVSSNSRAIGPFYLRTNDFL